MMGGHGIPGSYRHGRPLPRFAIKVLTPAARQVRSTPIRQGLPASFKREGVAYAVALDRDIEQLRTRYGDPYNNACLEIRRVLERHGFARQQGGVNFGGPAVTAASAMVAVIDLTTQPPWFAAAVRDIRMLRIEELNDLMPVVHRIAGMAGGGGNQ